MLIELTFQETHGSLCWMIHLSGLHTYKSVRFLSDSIRWYILGLGKASGFHVHEKGRFSKKLILLKITKNNFKKMYN